MNWKEIGLRFVWTVIAAVAGSIGAVASPIDITVVQAAGVAGVIAAVTFISLLARDVLGMLDASSYLQRIGWTFAQAAAGAFIAAPIMDISGIKAALTVGAIAAFNALSMVARDRSTLNPAN